MHGVKEESMESHTSLRKAISEIFSMHYGMLNMNVYGAHQVGKHCVALSREMPIVCTMTNDKSEGSYVTSDIP